MDEEAAILTKSLDEKQQQLKELKNIVQKKKKYGDLLGSHDINSILERYKSLKKSTETNDGVLKSLEAKIENLRTEEEQRESDTATEDKVAADPDISHTNVEESDEQRGDNN